MQRENKEIEKEDKTKTKKSLAVAESLYGPEM